MDKKQLINGWIPVCEKLPECDGLYLCTQQNYGKRHIAIVAFEKGRFEDTVEWGYPVIAWQPLPEPYKEK